MKLTSPGLIAVLVLSCAAAFGQTTVKLGFLSHDKQTQYEDWEQLTVEKSTIVTGSHCLPNTPTGCNFRGTPPNGVMAGVVAIIPASSGLTVTGKVATFADNTYDNQQGYMGACQCSEYYVSILRPSTPEEIQNNVFGWALYTNFGGTASLQNFGFTTKQLGNNGENSANTFDLPVK
jgi:hypothetical protein